MPLSKIPYFPNGIIDRIILRKDSEEQMNLNQFVDMVKSKSHWPKATFVVTRTLGSCKKIVDGRYDKPIDVVYEKIMKNPYLEMDREILGYHTTYRNMFNSDDIAHHLLLYRSDAFCEVFFRNK